MSGSPTERKARLRLLDTIKAIRAGIGDGLNDNELTRLMRESTLLGEAGFGFVCFCDGYVTLSVPEQDPASWYPEKGWIAPEKEKVAREIACEYGLSLYEPVNAATNFWHPQGDSAPVRHHLELTDRWQTVVVAHPQYLKIRLYGKSSDHRYSWEALYPLPLGPDLLQELSALYSA